MRILDRYVLGAFLKNYLISLFVLVGLYVLLDLVFNFDEFVEVQTHATSGSSSFFSILYVIGDYYFYQSFYIFSELSAVIPVAATAFTLVRFARFNELSPVMAAGIPLIRFAAPIVFAALALNLLVVLDQELLIPRLIPKLTRTHDQVALGAPTKVQDIKAMQDDEGALLFASRYIPATEETPAQMFDVTIIERDKAGDATGKIVADRADFDAVEKSWKLLKGTRSTGLRQRDRRAERPLGTYKSEITPDEIALYRNGNYVDLLSTSRINQLLERPQKYGPLNLLRVKHGRVTQWFMNLIAVGLGIGVILTREPGTLKNDGLKLLVIIGLSMGAVFLCNQLAVHPPAGDAWQSRWPAIMSFTPIFIFGPFAIFLLDWMHTKKS